MLAGSASWVRRWSSPKVSARRRHTQRPRRRGCITPHPDALACAPPHPTSARRVSLATSRDMLGFTPAQPPPPLPSPRPFPPPSIPSIHASPTTRAVTPSDHPPPAASRPSPTLRPQHPRVARTHVAGHVGVGGQRRRHLHEGHRLGRPHRHGRRRPRHWPGRHPRGGAAAQHRGRGRDKGANKRHGCCVRWRGWGARGSDRRRGRRGVRRGRERQGALRRCGKAGRRRRIAAATSSTRMTRNAGRLSCAPRGCPLPAMRGALVQPPGPLWRPAAELP